MPVKVSDIRKLIKDITEYAEKSYSITLRHSDNKDVISNWITALNTMIPDNTNNDNADSVVADDQLIDEKYNSRYQYIVSADTGCRNSTLAWLSNSYQMTGIDQSISSDPAMRLPARDQPRCRRANDSDQQLHLDQTRANLCRTRQDARLITLDIAL